MLLNIYSFRVITIMSAISDSYYIIALSSGHDDTYPIYCWQFYLDGFKSIAYKMINLNII